MSEKSESKDEFGGGKKWEMYSKEKPKSVTTMRELLLISNMEQYLPFFEKANIFQASALKLLKEDDLKYIGIDNCGRQKLLRAARHLPKNVSMTVGGKIRQEIELTEHKINEKFCLQKAQDELMRCKVELNSKRNELARLQKQAKLIHEIFEMISDAREQIRKLRKNCHAHGNLSMQRTAIHLESSLNTGYLPNINSIPSNGNKPISSVALNINSQYPKTQQHVSGLLLKQLKKQNTPRHYYSQEKVPVLRMQGSCSPVSSFTAPYCNLLSSIDGDNKYNKTTISLSTPAMLQYEHESFMNELFSKFRKNNTSTLYKQQ